jgi:hypothetical protein
MSVVEDKNMQLKLDVEVYCDQKVLMGLGMIARVNQQITDLGNATLTYKGDFESGFNEIPRKSGDLAAMCQYGLPDSYVRDKIEDVEDADANLILIQRDISITNGKSQLGSVRSISLVQVTHNPDREGHVGSEEDSAIELQDDEDISPETTDMDVLVLGSQKIPNVRSRQMQSKIYARGGNVLKAIQFLGSKLAHGIVLYGLETVITLYYKFGWRFVAACGDVEERCKYAPAVKALYNFLKVNGVPMEEGVVRTEEVETEYNRVLTNLLKPFAPFSHDMYAILSKNKTLEEGEQGAAAARETARDDGYRMLLCPKNNPYSGNNKKQKRGGNKGTESEFEMWVNNLGNTCALPLRSKSLGKRKRGGTKKRNKRKNVKKTEKKALKKRHRTKKKALKKRHQTKKIIKKRKKRIQSRRMRR